MIDEYEAYLDGPPVRTAAEVAESNRKHLRIKELVAKINNWKLGDWPRDLINWGNELDQLIEESLEWPLSEQIGMDCYGVRDELYTLWVFLTSTKKGE